MKKTFNMALESVQTEKLTQDLYILGKAFQDWENDPVLNYAVLVRLLHESLAPTNKSCTTELREACHAHITAMSHRMLRDNITLSPYYALELAKLYCDRPCWEYMLAHEEQHLLSALLLATGPCKINSQIHVMIQRVITEWTGSEFTCLWLGSFEDFKVEHKNLVATCLFGETWAFLYQQELQGSCSDVYAAVLGSQPDLTFSAKPQQPPTDNNYDLPGDM